MIDVAHFLKKMLEKSKTQAIGAAAMAIRIACVCGRPLEFGLELAGKVASCPNCGDPVRIPVLARSDAPQKDPKSAMKAKEAEPGKSSPWPKTSLNLLMGVRDGAAKDWETFVNIYAPLVYGYCRAKGLQDADADAVTWDVLAKVQRFEYDPARGRFHNWLLTVTQREVNHLKKKSSAQAGQWRDDLPQENVASSTDIDWDRLCQAHIFKAAIARIRPEFDDVKWQAFEAVGYRPEDSPHGKTWVEVGNPSYQTVAADLDKSVDWVYKAKSEILRRLKEEIRYLAEDLGILT